MDEAWEEEDSEKNLGWTDFFIKYGIFLLLIIFVIIFHNRFGNVSWDKATTIAISIGFGIIMVNGLYSQMKNKTPKFVFNDGFDTTAGEIKQIGNYAVILPGIKAFGMYLQFKSPVYVTPIDGIRHRGRNLVGNVTMEQVILEELPPQVRGYVIEKGLKPPYMLGMADVDQYMMALKDPEKASSLEMPSVGYLISQAKENNKMNAMLTHQLAEAYNVSEDTIASKMRLLERMKPQDWSSSLKNLLMDNKKDAA